MHDAQAETTFPARAPDHKRALKQRAPQVRCDARPRVSDHDPHFAPFRSQNNLDLPAFWCVAQCVIEEVADRALDQAQVGTHSRKLWWEVSSKRDPSGVSSKFKLLKHVLHQIHHREGFEVWLDEPILQSSKLKEALREPPYLPALIDRDLQVAAPFARVQSGVFQQQRL